MPTLSSHYDGASLFYRQYAPQSSAPSFRESPNDGKPRPALVFSAGWPFDGRMYNHLIRALTETHRYPCILPDRRGFGRSEWSGPSAFQKNDIAYEALAGDLHQIIEACPDATEQGFVAIGTSMACGEIIEMLSNDTAGNLAAKCKGIVFICSALPIPMWTEAKPVGPKRDFWDDILDKLRESPDDELAGALTTIFGSYITSMPPFEKARYERMMADADPVATERIVQIFTNRDFTEKLRGFGKRFNIPVLILHGSEDVANPVDVSPKLVQSLLPGSQVKVYEGAGHGLYQSHKQKCLQDIIEFVQRIV